MSLTTGIYKEGNYEYQQYHSTIICIFGKREGRLDEVLSILADNDVNIVALSLADTSDYGMLRMIVSDPQKGRATLKAADITSMLTDVVALRVPHATGSLNKAMHQIVEGGINIQIDVCIRQWK